MQSDKLLSPEWDTAVTRFDKQTKRTDILPSQDSPHDSRFDSPYTLPYIQSK